MKLGVPYVIRYRDALPLLFERAQKDEVILVTKQDWRYERADGYRFHFHPNMSALRVKNLIKGESDSLVEVAKLHEGDYVLDCTLGMGADSIVASFAVGSTGKVVGLESQQQLALIVEHGLQTYKTNRTKLDEAMSRVQVIHANYREFLCQLPDDSYDVVVFDPMFRETIVTSSAMQVLKPLANPEALDPESVSEASRVARRAVLLKERAKSGEFERLGFTIVKESSHFAWGIIRKGDWR